MIEAALFYAHKRDQSEVRSSEIAEKATAILMGRGHEQEISAESVGWTLKRLGVPRSTLGSAGNGIKMTDDVRARIHELAMSHDVPTLRAAPRHDCKFCAKLRDSDAER